MRLNKVGHLFILFLLIQGCGNKTADNKKVFCPLQAPYEYFDQLSQTEFYFADMDYRLNEAKGKNKTDVVDSVTKEFDRNQKLCIQKLEAKFPTGSITIPFEQARARDSIVIKSAYVSGFEFPWTTATSICYYFTVEYDILRKDIWFLPIPLRFVDSENDIINMCTLSANSSGKSRFSVKAQPSFRIFTKLLIY